MVDDLSRRRQRYDAIGAGYTRHRRADARLVDAVVAQLGLAAGARIAEVGAGSGNYAAALADRGVHVIAVEPSRVMRAQASCHPAVRWIAAVAEQVPLADASVDGIACILAVHHFRSAASAAAEMMRVAARAVVLFTLDTRLSEPFWLEDYFPEIFAAAMPLFPPLRDVRAMFEDAGMDVVTSVFRLPHDLHDLFLAAAWRRPELYLDAEVRSCMSAFPMANPEVVRSGVRRLRDDLASGKWRDRHGTVLTSDDFDGGYRFVTARRTSAR